MKRLVLNVLALAIIAAGATSAFASTSMRPSLVNKCSGGGATCECSGKCAADSSGCNCV